MRYLTDNPKPHGDTTFNPQKSKDRAKMAAAQRTVQRLADVLAFEETDPLVYFRGGGPDPALGVASPVTVRRLA